MLLAAPGVFAFPYDSGSGPSTGLTTSNLEFTNTPVVGDLVTVAADGEFTASTPLSNVMQTNSTDTVTAPKTFQASAAETTVITLTASTTGDDPQEVVQFARGTTTDGVATTIWTIDLDANTTYLFEANVMGRRTGGAAGAAGDSAGYKVFGAVVDIAGTATAAGAGTTTVITLEDQAGWNAVFALSSGNVLLQVTGATDNNVVWHAVVRVMKVAS